ncbi:hypothetical protein [Arthrobacter sp. GMC3]|uniref:hypothetical protein n=1 Tax=Arthrobacter sp. GMC3 TaxID=2058894 RepID=UPI0011AFED4B|nr:hypothetical protein [Arthrobacter sp. GMC3]
MSVVFGIVPLLWWIPLEWSGNIRSSLLFSAVAGVVAFCVIWSQGNNVTGRSILPKIRSIDVVPVAAAGVGVLVYVQQLMVRSVDDAMSLMLMAWDNASHFNIFHMQRLHGSVLPLAGLAGDGSRWAFSDYPQSYHSALVLVSEIARKTSPQDWEADAVTYVNFTAVVNIMVVLLVVAAICSLPGLRKNPIIGIPIATLVASGWLFGPGALASMHGFPNFFFTTGLVAAAIVLFHSMQRVFDPLPLIAAGACVAGVVQNWALSIVFLIPCVIAVVFITKKGRWKANRGELVIAVLLVGVVAMAGLTAVGQLLTVAPDDILFAAGGVPDPDFGLLLALLLMLVSASIFMQIGKGPNLPSPKRTQWSLGSVWAGTAVVVAMAAAQLIKTGSVSYYTQKFSIALALIALLCLGIAANGIVERTACLGRVRTFSSSPKLLATAVVVSLAFTQVFGFAFPFKPIGLPPSSESGLEAAKQIQSKMDGSAANDNLLRAVRQSVSLEGPVMYLTTNPGDIDVILAQQWFDALRGNYSEHSWKLSLNMFPLSGGPDNLTKVVTDLRFQDPSVRIVVDPENQAALDQILTKHQ